jgi:hypothetical protein
LEQAANARGDLRKTVDGEFAPTVKTTLGFHGNPKNTGAFPKRLILFLKSCSAIRFRQKTPRLAPAGFLQDFGFLSGF